jgi:hypothetical protein
MPTRKFVAVEVVAWARRVPRLRPPYIADRDIGAQVAKIHTYHAASL